MAGGCGGGGGLDTLGGSTGEGERSSLAGALAAGAVADADLQEYVARLGRRLTEAAEALRKERRSPFAAGAARPPRDVSFAIVRCPVPNVAVVPPGSVFVTDLLVRQCRSEDELAAAMAHGLGHVLAGHENGRAAAALVPGQTAAETALALAGARHSPAQEAEADRLAVLVHARAGYDPAAMVALLEGLHSDRSSGVRPTQEQVMRVSIDEWARPPVADARRFARHRSAAVTREGAVPAEQAAAARLAAALPNCLLPEDLPAQERARRELMPPPPSPPPALHGPAVEPPPSFEKGHRRLAD